MELPTTRSKPSNSGTWDWKKNGSNIPFNVAGGSQFFFEISDTGHCEKDCFVCEYRKGDYKPDQQKKEKRRNRKEEWEKKERRKIFSLLNNFFFLFQMKILCAIDYYTCREGNTYAILIYTILVVIYFFCWFFDCFYQLVNRNQREWELNASQSVGRSMAMELPPLTTGFLFWIKKQKHCLYLTT